MSTKNEAHKYPACYGNLQKVFPLGKDGLRHSPDDCLACANKTECLRAAIRAKEGLKVQEEHIDRAYHSGMISFLERWSKKKHLFRRKKKCL
jgi:hypothetical protein